MRDAAEAHYRVARTAARIRTNPILRRSTCTDSPAPPDVFERQERTTSLLCNALEIRRAHDSQSNTPWLNIRWLLCNRTRSPILGRRVCHSAACAFRHFSIHRRRLHLPRLASDTSRRLVPRHSEFLSGQPKTLIFNLKPSNL